MKTQGFSSHLLLFSSPKDDSKWSTPGKWRTSWGVSEREKKPIALTFDESTQASTREREDAPALFFLPLSPASREQRHQVDGCTESQPSELRSSPDETLLLFFQRQSYVRCYLPPLPFFFSLFFPFFFYVALLLRAHFIRAVASRAAFARLPFFILLYFALALLTKR